MKLQKRMITLMLCTALAVTAGLSGCTIKFIQPQDQSSVQEAGQSSVQESEPEQSQQSVIQESSEAVESSAVEKSAESSETSGEESISAPEESTQEESSVFKDSSAEQESERIIGEYNSGNITEKEMFDMIYELDDISAEGHVITDIDNDGAYELVTRGNGKKLIKIYEVTDGKLELAGMVEGEDKADLIYSFKDITSEEGISMPVCYFSTLKSAGDYKTSVRILNYNGPDSEMTEEASFIVEVYNDGKMDRTRYLDENGNQIEDDKGIIAFATYRWRESFNDDCCNLLPETAEELIVEEEQSMEGIIYMHPEDENTDKKYYHQKSEIYNKIHLFPKLYYKHDDTNPWLAFGTAVDGLYEAWIERLAKEEMLAKYNYKFDSPLTTAFMNKKPEYNADPTVSLDDVLESMSENERINYDNLH